MTLRLIGAAAAFTGTVVAGLLAGILAERVTGRGWLMPVGLFAGLALGIGAIVVALRPLMKSP